jgi:hypothetical protein
MSRLLFAFMLIIGVVLMFGGVLDLFIVKRTRSWKVGGGCLLAGAIIVAVAVSVESCILGI